MRRMLLGFALLFSALLTEPAHAMFVDDSSVVEQDERGEDMVLRAKIEGESFELGDKCYLNGSPEKEFEVRGLKGNPAGPFQMVNVGVEQWFWSHQLIADLPEIEVFQVARAGSVDPRAMEASLRNKLYEELKEAGIDLPAMLAKKRAEKAATQPAPALAPKKTAAQLRAELAELEAAEGGGS